MKDLSNADLLAVLVGQELATSLANRPLAELFGFTKPRQTALNETPATYIVHPALVAAKELFVRCIRERMESEDLCFSSPEMVQAFLCANIGHLEHESFWCLWLDAQHRLIEAGELFRGTLRESTVHPREVVKKALAVNAAAVIFAHNHPSGMIKPSQADEVTTANLKQALALVDVRVLDHFIVGGNKAMSFAKNGLL